MKKRVPIIVVFLVIGLVFSLCSGCNQGEDIFNEKNFAFRYHMKEQKYQKGCCIEITTKLINDSEHPHSFYGIKADFMAYPTLYCAIDGLEYCVPMRALAFPDIAPSTIIIDAHEEASQTYYFDVPEDAPSGQYHLRVSYKNAEETFYNVFALSEEG